MKINHISISRESCYQECQQKYKFRYHLEVVVPGVTPIYLTFGKIVHRVAEEYIRSQGKQTMEQVAKDVLSGKLELQPGEKAPKLEPEYKNKLARHLKNLARFTEKIGMEGEVEWKFDFDLDPPHNRKVTGFIDRLINKDGQYFIFDYKTTKPSIWRKDSRNITKDLQLMCYCYVVMKEFNVDPQNIHACLLYLDDYKSVPVRFSEKTLLTVPERLLKVYKEIENLDPDRVWGNVGQHCQRCDYRKLCPFYSLT